MKYFFTFLVLLGFAAPAFAKDALKDKLYNINHCWKDHQDVHVTTITPPQTDKDWIRLHLSHVEQTLRNTKTNLTPEQEAKRMQCLDILNQYWKAGNFPINDQYTYRTPIFIDKYDNFCAVGYLVKMTGYEAISRKISRETNLAYVKEMEYPELMAWAGEYGFTVDELAWIQPSYGPPPSRNCEPVGKGTNGDIYELYVGANDKLYVGGTFTIADSTVMANNIAYVTENNGIYTWHAMGSGVNGPVYAITEFNNKVYVAGEFTEAGGTQVTNVAYWDGTAWHAAGCTYGKIYDLAVFNNELYAVGDFDVCAALSEINFAKWNGLTWFQVNGMLSGHVNTIEVDDNSLLLGGDFMYNNTQHHAIRWNASTNLYEEFATPIPNEVKDFEIFHDTLYAACKRTNPYDSNLVMYLDNSSSWQSAIHPVYGSDYSFNTLCVQGDTLMSGGRFDIFYMMMNAPYYNCMPIAGTTGASEWFTTDESIEKMVVFKGDLIAAGKFTGSFNYQTWDSVKVNHIAKKGFPPITGVPPVCPGDPRFVVSPNPVAAGGKLQIENDFSATQLLLTDITGKRLMEQPVSTNVQYVNMPMLIPGYYMMTLTNSQGIKKTQKLIVQ